ncbi:MAG: MGMT family protein [Candidatus Parvarchaeota archaeon]|nr:MGMT family protein [Candidatus Parvarchaeota archaeon]
MSKDRARELLEFLRRIPHGKVVTYGMLAKKFDLNPRYVGMILSRNDKPDYYPCYKVVRSDLTVGGYTISHENNRRTKDEKVKRLKKDGVILKEGKIEKSALYRLR